jgi:hypothetical protein
LTSCRSTVSMGGALCCGTSMSDYGQCRR